MEPFGADDVYSVTGHLTGNSSSGELDYYFPVETSQTPMFNRIGTARKRYQKYGSGHIPSEREDFARLIVAWLDEHLGTVPLR